MKFWLQCYVLDVLNCLGMQRVSSQVVGYVFDVLNCLMYRKRLYGILVLQEYSLQCECEYRVTYTDPLLPFVTLLIYIKVVLAMVDHLLLCCVA